MSYNYCKATQMTTEQDLEELEEEIKSCLQKITLTQYHTQLEIILMDKQLTIHERYINYMNNLKWYQYLFRYHYYSAINFKRAVEEAEEIYAKQIENAQKNITAAIKLSQNSSKRMEEENLEANGDSAS